MAQGKFIVEELQRVGGRNLGATGERFEWTADWDAEPNIGGDPVGARSAPEGVWNIGGQLRTVRTDYTGALVPSEQVLGPRHKDTPFEGVWDDRYNFHGFAVDMMRRFEALCWRGNPVRVSFQRQVFEGLIKEWDFPYKGDWYCGYRFTVSMHNRVDNPAVPGSTTSLPGSIAGLTRIQPTVPSVDEAVNDTDLATVSALDAHNLVPRNELGAGIADSIETALGAMATARDEALRTIDGRPQRPELSPLDQFRRLSSQLRQVKSNAVDLLNTLGDVRADISVDVRTAKSVMDFEDWSRSMRYAARNVMGTSHLAARQVEQKVKPRAKRVYRPTVGESLYSVSRRFYGTPYAWSYIAEYNNLQTINLTGNELLVIPERGAG